MYANFSGPHHKEKDKLLSSGVELLACFAEDAYTRPISFPTYEASA